MAIDPPSDSRSRSPPMPSQSEFDRFCSECCWHGMDMTSNQPVPPSHCLDLNCADSGNATALEPCHPPQSPCDLDVTCCEAQDCSPTCTTVCDGFVDCTRTTPCAESHCDDVDCHDVATACYDEHCAGEGSGDFDPITNEILNQGIPIQWKSSPSSSCHSNHVNRVFPTAGYEGASGQEGQRVGGLSPADNPSAPKQFDGSHVVASQCASGRFPQVFDHSMCPSQGYLVPGNVLQCTMPDPCYNLDACIQQCNFNSGLSPCPTHSHLGFTPWDTAHEYPPHHHYHYHYHQHQHQHQHQHEHQHEHEEISREMKMASAQPCHHLHREPAPVRPPSAHTPALSIGSSPITPPDYRSQSISTTLTAPDLTSPAAEESHVCRWMHRNADGAATLCGASFPDTASLQQHLTHAHSDAISGERGQGFYCCWEGCHRPDEPFSQKSKLQGHFLTHSNHKNFRCPTCGKSFARQATLERHERSHSGDKPYECKQCDKSFTDSSELKTHLRTHTGEKPFKCNIPGCTFETGDSSNMSSHKLTHGVRKHKCPFPRCSKSFTRPDQLKRHLKSTHKTGSMSPGHLSPSSTRHPSVTSP